MPTGRNSMLVVLNAMTSRWRCIQSIYDQTALRRKQGSEAVSSYRACNWVRFDQAVVAQGSNTGVPIPAARLPSERGCQLVGRYRAVALRGKRAQDFRGGRRQTLAP